MKSLALVMRFVVSFISGGGDKMSARSGDANPALTSGLIVGVELLCWSREGGV